MAVDELHAEEQKMTRKEVSLFTWLHNHVLYVEDQVRASDTKPTMSLLPTAQDVLGRGQGKNTGLSDTSSDCAHMMLALDPGPRIPILWHRALPLVGLITRVFLTIKGYRQQSGRNKP